MIRIGPFNYEPLRGVDLWLAQSDEVILQHLSTSPDVELPQYVMEVISLYLLYTIMAVALAFDATVLVIYNIRKNAGGAGL